MHLDIIITILKRKEQKRSFWILRFIDGDTMEIAFCGIELRTTAFNSKTSTIMKGVK